MKDVPPEEISKGVTLWKIPTPSSCPVFARCQPTDLSVNHSPLIIHLRNLLQFQEIDLERCKGRAPLRIPSEKARGKKPTNSSKLALFQRVFHHPWKHRLFASSETIRSVSGLCEFWAPFPERQKAWGLQRHSKPIDGPQSDRGCCWSYFFWGGGVCS